MFIYHSVALVGYMDQWNEVMLLITDTWYLSEREMLGRRASLIGELARLPNSNSR